jgi:nucleoside phosphorylase
MNDALIVCQHAFGVVPDRIGAIAILMERDRTEQYKGAFDKVLYEIRGGVYSGVTGLVSGTPVSAIYSKGPADIADCVAFLGMSKTACRTVLSTGSIGGLGDNVGMGDFVLATEAIGHDGYSQFIAREKGLRFPRRYDNVLQPRGDVVTAITDTVACVAREYGVRAHSGRIFTIPGVSLESEALLDDLLGNGCIAIDMETSQFYAACHEWEFDSAAVHWVTDLPLTRSFFEWFRDPPQAQADWDLKHPIWLNMAGIIVSVVRTYVEGQHTDGH